MAQSNRPYGVAMIGPLKGEKARVFLTASATGEFVSEFECDLDGSGTVVAKKDLGDF